MAAFIVYNRTTDNIQLTIPTPRGSKRQFASLILAGSGAVDILPYAGSIENCRRIAQIYDLTLRNLVFVVEK